MSIIDISRNSELKFHLREIKGFLNLTSFDFNNTKCYGSIKNLKSLTKLNVISVHNTEIKFYLEQLNEYVQIRRWDDIQEEIVPIEWRFKKNLRVNKIIKKILDNKRVLINESNESFNIKKWLDENREITDNNERLIWLKERRKEIESSFLKKTIKCKSEKKSELLKEIFTNHNNGFLLWVESEIERCKSIRRNYYENFLGENKHGEVNEELNEYLNYELEILFSENNYNVR